MMGGKVVRWIGVLVALAFVPAEALATDGVLCRDLVTPPGAVYVTDDAATARFLGNTFVISGDDWRLDGTPGPQPPTLGIAARTAAIADGVRQGLTTTQLDNVKGLGFSLDPLTPSIGVMAEPSPARIAAFRETLLALPAVQTYSGAQINGLFTFGTQASPKITRFTNAAGLTVRAHGNIQGTGVMIVDHDLVIEGGTFDFRGLVLVGGSTTVRSDVFTGSTIVLGSLWTARLGQDAGHGLGVLSSSAALNFAAGLGVCQPSRCGDGETTYDEQCDDGNLADGDCCSSTCTLEPSGSACGDDGNVCTADTCDGLGACTHPPTDAACDDGNACTADDQCNAGACAGSTIDCGACMACDAPRGCLAAPRNGCRASLVPAKSRLVLDRGTPTKAARLVWRWRKGEATAVADLGDDSDTRALCVFGGDAVLLRTALPPLLCTDRTCRTAPRATGDDPHRIKVRFGSDQRAQLDVDARGDDLLLPAAPGPLPLTVQLQSANGACFETHHPESSVLRQDARRFEARGGTVTP